MTTLVLVLPTGPRELALGSDTASALAELGITQVALFGDEHTAAIVLNGWAFDPNRSTRTAVDVVAGPDASCRALRLVAELTIAPGTQTRAAQERR